MIIGSIVLVVVAFFFLSRALSWNYVSELVKDHDDPEAIMDTPVEPVTTYYFSLAVSLDENQYQRLEQLLIEMRELYPRINIDMTNFFENNMTYNAWENKMQLDQLGDIQLIPNDWILPLAIQGQLQPVDRLMSSESVSAQLPGIVDALKWNGYTWGMPYWNNPHFIVYRKDIVAYLEQNEINEINVERQHELQLLIDYMTDHPENTILNINSEHYLNFLIWSTYFNGEQQGGITLEHTSEGDKAFSQWLIEHQSIITESNYLSKDNLPLIYMTTWDNYTAEEELLDDYYKMDAIQSPIPWINGDSFVIQAGSEESSIMVEWLEKLIQLASTQFFNDGGIPTRSLEYMVGSDINFSYMLTTLQQKLENKQLMQVTLNWSEKYEERKLQWSSQQGLERKLLNLAQ